VRAASRMLLVFGRCRIPTCHSTPLVELLASTLSLLFAGGLDGGLAVRHSEVRLSNATLRLLVWISVRVLGSGRVEPRSNGGCWAQGVCRGQSSNRGVRERGGGDFGGGVWAWCLVKRPKEKRKKKKVESKMHCRPPQATQRTRSWSFTAPATLPNEQAVAALPCIQHILDANRLTWSDVGHHPDGQFASFIHASQRQEPNGDLIIDTRRKCRSWLRLKPPRRSLS
jgi:hypothetical protein